MRIIFVRHGESEANVQKIFSNRGWKHPLTRAGREQIERLAEDLATRSITAIYSSPLRRAVESAEILSERLKLPFKTKTALSEYDVGVYEDGPHADGAQEYDTVARKWASGDLNVCINGGESCKQIRDRFVPFIDRLTARFAKQRRVRVVLIGHGGTYRHALPAVLRNITSDFAMQHGLKNAEYVEARLQNGEWFCVRWGEVPITSS